jgi:hypothetical protein
MIPARMTCLVRSSGMGGVNPVLQLAAALDRRGVTASVESNRVFIHLGKPRQYIEVQAHSGAVPCTEWGRHWFWRYAGQAECSHPSDDYEGAADAIEKFLRDIPGLADTRLLYRMNHIGWTGEQEAEEILERGRASRASGDGETSRSRGRPGAIGNRPKARRPARA